MLNSTYLVSLFLGSIPCITDIKNLIFYQIYLALSKYIIRVRVSEMKIKTFRLMLKMMTVLVIAIFSAQWCIAESQLTKSPLQIFKVSSKAISEQIASNELSAGERHSPAISNQPGTLSFYCRYSAKRIRAMRKDKIKSR